MGRLRAETLTRVRTFANRVLHVVETLESQGRSRRLLDQLTASGCSVGANLYEADEAMSRADFAKTLGIVIKELNETRFWLELCVMREWIQQDRLDPLLEEALQLKKMFGAMITRTRKTADGAKKQV